MIKLKDILGEAKEIGGYYLMKQLKDLAQDAKRSGERKVAKALMYLHDRINQSSRDIDLNADDLNDFLNEPRGRKHARDLPDWMIDDLFESVNKKLTEISTLGVSGLKSFAKKHKYSVKSKKSGGRVPLMYLSKGGKQFGPFDPTILTKTYLLKKLGLNERVERNEVHAETKKELKLAISNAVVNIAKGKIPKFDIINGRTGEMIGWVEGHEYHWQPGAIADALRELK